ncbi:MAG: hypothetical protein QM765_31210 [Myxococcales bacterium]
MAAMLGFTKADDELLAKGWPHLTRLLDDHRHDHAPEKFALAVVSATEPVYFSDWPREVAYRFLRTGCVSEFKDKVGNGLSSKTKAALADPRPVEKAEAGLLLYEAVKSSEEGAEFKVRDFVFAAEAIAGTDAALEAICSGLEDARLKLPKNLADPMHTVFKGHVAGTVGFLLLRASAAAKKKATKRLAAVREKLAATEADAWDLAAINLDVSIEGAAAVKRAFAGKQADLQLVQYAHDDPAFVRRAVTEDLEQPISLRHVAIGGPRVMEGLANRRFPLAQIPYLMRDFGMVKAPQTVELALALMNKASAKGTPRKWFEEHADYARPFLDKLAKGAAEKARSAKTVYQQIA